MLNIVRVSFQYQEEEKVGKKKGKKKSAKDRLYTTAGLKRRVSNRTKIEVFEEEEEEEDFDNEMEGPVSGTGLSKGEDLRYYAA